MAYPLVLAALHGYGCGLVVFTARLYGRKVRSCHVVRQRQTMPLRLEQSRVAGSLSVSRRVVVVVVEI